MEEQAFQFELGDEVVLRLSEERGIVRGRAQYLNSENQYEVLYKAGDGRQVCSWWAESTIR